MWYHTLSYCIAGGNAQVRLTRFPHTCALLQARPNSRRQSRRSLAGSTPPSALPSAACVPSVPSRRWIAPSPTPTAAVSSGARSGRSASLSSDGMSDQGSPVNPRKVRLVSALLAYVRARFSLWMGFWVVHDAAWATCWSNRFVEEPHYLRTSPWPDGRAPSCWSYKCAEKG